MENLDEFDIAVNSFTVPATGFINSATNPTERIDLATDGTEANNSIFSISLSDDARFIVFESSATNLVTGDTAFDRDIFLRDRQNQTTERISLGLDDPSISDDSFSPLISGDDRYIVYTSYFNDDTNSFTSDTALYVYDRTEEMTERLNIDITDTIYTESISDDGRYITFNANYTDIFPEVTLNPIAFSQSIFLYDRTEATIEHISQIGDDLLTDKRNNESSISDDGRYVTFSSSDIGSLNPPQPIGFNVSFDNHKVLLRDRENQTTQLISLGFDGSEANGSSSNPIISGDGRSIIFYSSASNLVPEDNNDKRDVFIYDIVNQTTELIDIPLEEDSSNSRYIASISDDGRFIGLGAFDDPVLFDRNTNTTSRIAEEDFTLQGFLGISGDGNSLAYKAFFDPAAFVVERSELISDQDFTRFNTDEIHRFYEFNRGVHFYTTDDSEIETVRDKSNLGELFYQDEATKFVALSDDKDTLTGETLAGVKPVYRFFNTDTGSHFYTMDENEKNIIQTTLSNYNFEGIEYYAFESPPEDIETIPVFRLINSQSNSHLFTVDQNEINYIQTNLPNFALENNGNAAFYVFEL